MRNFSGSVIRNPQFYFRKGITWSTISNGDLSMRYSPEGHLFESKGSVCFFIDDNDLEYILGIMNTKIVKNLLLVLSPTIDYHEGPLGRVPIILNRDLKADVEKLVEENISFAKTGLGFHRNILGLLEHPFVRWSKGLWDCTNISASVDYFYGSQSLRLGALLNYVFKCFGRANVMSVSIN